MHEPEKWGIIQFSNQLVSGDVAFIKDEDMLVKQVAFALFRKTRDGSLNRLLSENVGTIQKVDTKFSATESLKATFFKTHFGFEYVLKNSLKGHTFIINEEGTLKTL